MFIIQATGPWDYEATVLSLLDFMSKFDFDKCFWGKPSVKLSHFLRLKSHHVLQLTIFLLIHTNETNLYAWDRIQNTYFLRSLEMGPRS
jgi:hypothetical protein